jgi:hypothetical protein
MTYIEKKLNSLSPQQKWGYGFSKLSFPVYHGTPLDSQNRLFKKFHNDIIFTTPNPIHALGYAIDYHGNELHAGAIIPLRAKFRNMYHASESFLHGERLNTDERYNRNRIIDKFNDGYDCIHIESEPVVTELISKVIEEIADYVFRFHGKSSDSKDVINAFENELMMSEQYIFKGMANLKQWNAKSYATMNLMDGNHE